jgi:hypothetical protein
MRIPPRIVLHELAAFSTIALILWIDELLVKPTNVRHAVVGSLACICVAIPTVLMTWRITKRLHYLEGFMKVCAWCSNVGHKGQWVPLSTYMLERLDTETSHGICTECTKRFKERKP